MRYKVELHRDVRRFVRHTCNEDEVDAFYARLRQIEVEPIEHSEAVADPDLSRYMLRFFRFGSNIAIFEFVPAKSRTRVLQCKRLPPKVRRRSRAGEPPPGP